MRFMLLIKSDKNTEAGVLPSLEVFAGMARFNEEMVKAGILLAADGLQASSKGARVQLSGKDKPVVKDGPFTEIKELICGYWIIDVKSREEAIAWATRVPNPHGEEVNIEVRQVFEATDFPADLANEAFAHTSR